MPLLHSQPYDPNPMTLTLNLLHPSHAQVLQMMNEITAKTHGLRHVRADEGDLDFVLERC